jgi:hypothetical protein
MASQMSLQPLPEVVVDVFLDNHQRFVLFILVETKRALKFLQLFSLSLYFSLTLLLHLLDSLLCGPVLPEYFRLVTRDIYI